MAPAMKAKKVATKAMKGQKVRTKGALLGELANATEMKKADISKVLNSLTEIGTKEVKKSGKFVLPGLCMIKTRTKAAVKGGGTRMMFGNHEQHNRQYSNSLWQNLEPVHKVLPERVGILPVMLLVIMSIE